MTDPRPKNLHSENRDAVFRSDWIEIMKCVRLLSPVVADDFIFTKAAWYDSAKILLWNRERTDRIQKLDHP